MSLRRAARSSDAVSMATDVRPDEMPQRRALREAAWHALAAPSIYNTQPWRWQLAGGDSGGELRLWAERDRRLPVTDADARQLMISCGAALHHAIVTLSAAGWQPKVVRFPDHEQPALLAVISVAGEHSPTPQDFAEYSAIHHRHTDRRAFTAESVPSAVLSALVGAAEIQGAHMYFVPTRQIGVLREAAREAEAAHQADPQYQAELAAWTSRPSSAGDGIPIETAVEPTVRLVPVRSFAPPGFGASPGFEHDVSASYGLIFTDTDSKLDCLRAGQALSAVLLTATAAGLGTAPISDIIEVPQTRLLITQLIDGDGFPQIAVRVGHPPAGEAPATPRRDPTTVIFDEPDAR